MQIYKPKQQNHSSFQAATFINSYKVNTKYSGIHILSCTYNSHKQYLYKRSIPHMQYDPYKHKAKTVEELSYPWGFNVPIDTENKDDDWTTSSNITKCKLNTS